MALDSMKEIFERSARENIPFWEIVLQYDMEERRLAELDRHAPSDLAHRVDDLVDGDAALDARERHIRRGDRVHRADDVALDARDLDKARDGVADHTVFLLNFSGSLRSIALSNAERSPPRLRPRHRI